MKKPSLRLAVPSPAVAAKHILLLVDFVFLNFALPEREPLSFALYYASLFCGFQPVAAGVGYVLASAAALSWRALLSALTQAVLFSLLVLVYRRLRRNMGMERLGYLLAAQIPFVLLFPHAGYELLPFAVIWQKCLIAAFCVLLSVLFEGGLHALIHRAFRCRLSAGQLAEIALMGILTGAGVRLALGIPAYYAISLTLLLFCVALVRNASALPFAVVLALPLCLTGGSLLPLAEYALYASLALLLAGYGRIASGLAVLIAFLAAQLPSGLYGGTPWEISLTLASCVLPVIVIALLPERAMARARELLLYYREHTLPRIALNRNRRAVGERLYEVSTLFREIEGAFSEEEGEVNGTKQLTDRLLDTFCADCPGNARCSKQGYEAQIERLVEIGRAKGQVTLVDLSAELSAMCGNAAGLLFACNKLLAGYRNRIRELESARESRRLLAEQAHGVSEILRDIAVEQSEEFSFSEGEETLKRALSAAGMLSSEIFIYGEGTALTVSMTLSPTVNVARLCAVAGAALTTPLALSEKIPLSATRSCYILRRKPEFDAAFGVASRRKEGEALSGDTYSVLKIDERRFMIALSDGMGSGEAAHTISDRTLSLLESFYKAKMPSETVLSTVNRLIAYSAEEQFSCLDLAAVDLDTGEADIVKIGSPVGFILSDEELRILEGESLPMGMLDAIHPATLQARMGENDFMLLMSDGVTEAFGSSDELYTYLSGLRPCNPQALAETVLDQALSRAGGEAEDDMTVLAVRLLKSA